MVTIQTSSTSAMFAMLSLFVAAPDGGFSRISSGNQAGHAGVKHELKSLVLKEINKVKRISPTKNTSLAPLSEIY